jgi:hypothetical protein
MSGRGEFHDIVNVATLEGEEGALWLATEQDYNKPYAPSGAWG